MMIEPMASYFVEIAGGDPKEIRKYTQRNSIVPDYLIESEDSSDAHLRYEVQYGAMDRWLEMDDVFTAMSNAFPGAEISVEEQCEEPWFPARSLRFHGGEKEETWGRIVDPGALDKVTIQQIVSLLGEHGMDEAKALVLASCR